MTRRWIILLMAAHCLLGSSWESLQAQPVAQPAPPVDSPLAVEPQTNRERLEAAVLMSNLGRNELARGYLKQLLDQKLSDEDLLALRDEFGTVELFRLSRITELQPLSQQLLAQVSAASRRNATDPARIDRILQDLDKSSRDRQFAIIELKNIGIMAVPRLLQHLGDPTSDQDRDRMVQILTQMGPQILPAMVGALDAQDVLMKTGVIEVLGLIGDSSVVQELWSPAFNEQEPPAVQAAARVALSRLLYGTAEKSRLVSANGVTARITATAREYFFRQKEMEAGEDGRVVVWNWDTAQGTVIPISVTPEAAGNAAAIRFSRQALNMVGEDVQIQALYLASLLADAGYRTGAQEALPTGPGTPFNLALTSGVPVLSTVVDLALEAGRVRVAETAMTAISLVGDRNLLRHSPQRPSPLIRGLNAPDRRVQFAAAVGVLQLEPKQSFSGSGRVVDILVQAVNDEGSQTALVIDPNIDRGRGIATAVGQMGYTQEVVSSGKAGFQLAAARGDIALVLLHVNTIDWELSQTIANFRADARTSSLPLVIYGPTFLEDDTRITIQRTPRSVYVVYSDQRAEVERQLKSFLDASFSPPLTNLQRTQRAQAAMFWLTRIAEERSHLFDLEPATETLFSAINTPELASGAITVLKSIPTRAAQTYLAESVLSRSHSTEIRIQATYALSQHVQQQGLLLEMELAALLKQLWEAEQDPALQTALTTLVGSFQPSSALIEKRLQEFAAPTRPAEN